MDRIHDQESDDQHLILGLDQLQYLSEVTKALGNLDLPNASGLRLRIAVSDEATDRAVGVWYNVEGQDWQLRILS